MPNCLVVDDMHPSLLVILEQKGISVRYEPTITKDQVLHIINDFEGIVVRSKFKIDKSFLELARHLKYIARAGSGKDNIDVAEAERLGIAILNAPEGNRDAVAEHAIGLLLNLLNNISKANAEVKSRIWKRENNRGVELGDKTVAIIGYGHTGRAVSKRLSGFGCKVLAYDINGIQNPESGVETASMEDIYRDAEVVTLHIPLDHRTKYLVDSHFLAQFRHPIWFINTSRGEVVHTRDLIQALAHGHVLGAGLDVLENEKLDQLNVNQEAQLTQLSGMQNVILSPHVAGWTHESYRKISEVLAQKIIGFYKSIA